MAGVYIHIPFCKQKCHYCNFFAVASKKYRLDFVDNLVSEIHHRKDYLSKEQVNTIYFGGGTPSLLKIEEIDQIIDAVVTSFNVNQEVEITLEANPDDLNKTLLKSLKNNTQINRLSIGIQSFFDDDLLYLNRIHNSKQAVNALKDAIYAGFTNLTVDLIYGIPTLTLHNWSRNLEIFFSLEIPHLSAYALTVEPKTALNTLIKKNKIQDIDEKQSIKHFELLIEETAKQEYVHYEISNFAQEGFYSKHNSIYWLGGHYIGVGPSAHSYNGISRQWNISNLQQYMQADPIEKVVKEKEVLTLDQRYNEYIMTSIRTSWGVDIEHVDNVFGSAFSNHFQQSANQLLKDNKILKNKNKYFLSDKGKLFADAVSADLFI